MQFDLTPAQRALQGKARELALALLPNVPQRLTEPSNIRGITSACCKRQASSA